MINKLFAYTSLPFALNIILPIFTFLAGFYPYPALFINQTDTFNDFYSICYWTFNKVGTYGEAYRNIYPPFAHLPCLLFSALLPDLEYGYDSARLLFPNFLPLSILYAVTITSFFFAYRSLSILFRLDSGWFIPWCLIASSPFIFLLDRGNLLMINIISLNIIICLLCSSTTRTRLAFILILAAIPVATKPYLVLNYIAFPISSLVVGFGAIALNLMAVVLWQPHAVHLILSNIRNFTDTSSLFVSIPALIADGQAFTSFRQYSKTLLQSLEYSSLFNSVAYEPLRFLIYSCLGLYYTYCLAATIFLVLIVYRIRFIPWYASRALDYQLRKKESQCGAYDALTLMMVSCSTYALVTGIIPLLTKSVYWYGVCHLLPCIMVADTVIYSSKAAFKVKIILFYQTIKVITLTSLIYPPMSRLCELEPFHRRFAIENFSFLYEFFNREYSCPTPGLETIAQFSVRMINLPLLCLLTAFILLKYLNAVKNGSIPTPLFLEGKSSRSKISSMTIQS